MIHKIAVALRNWLCLVAIVLGYCPPILAQGQSDARRLIVHIDDAGMCHAANVATMRCLQSGSATSASIMMPCGWVSEFAAFAKQHPEYCYGVHFTLNAEWDTLRWAPLVGQDRAPSLCDEHGYMWGSVDKVAMNAKASEVELELRAQVELALRLGIPISHFDTHIGSVMARPDLIEVYVKLSLEYDKPILWLRKLTTDQQEEYPFMAAAQNEVVQKLSQRKFPMIDTLLQYYGGDDLIEREKNYRQSIARVVPGVTQLIIHAAVGGDELAAVTTSHKRRNQDFELFSRPETKQWIENQQIELTSWKTLLAQNCEGGK